MQEVPILTEIMGHCSNIIHQLTLALNWIDEAGLAPKYDDVVIKSLQATLQNVNDLWSKTRENNTKLVSQITLLQEEVMKS